MIQLTAIQEVDKIHELLSQHLKELNQNSLGFNHLTVYGRLFLYTLEKYKTELELPSPRFSYELRNFINRQLASNLLLCIEGGLQEFIVDQYKCSVLNKRELSAFGCASTLLKKTDSLLSNSERKWLKNFRGKRVSSPDFYDLLDFVICSLSLIPAEQKKLFRRSFEFFTLVRNKASHLDASLTLQEIALIEEFSLKDSSKLRFQISVVEDEGLHYFEVTLIFFHQAWLHVKNFFELLYDEINTQS
ncbi:MAG TPA: hypothetical protein VFT64_02040 [Rickettsiales bacterium]|nr:hypothetical protein [Rickettsiales bacterium]